MAAPTCTATTLITNATCYKQSTIDAIEQQALRVYGMVLELAAIGGTDYTSTMTSTLNTDTTSLLGALREDQIKAGFIAKQFDFATAAGASVPATLKLKLDAINCLKHVPGGFQTLRQMELLLMCKLGVHRAYPQ